MKVWCKRAPRQDELPARVRYTVREEIVDTGRLLRRLERVSLGVPLYDRVREGHRSSSGESVWRFCQGCEWEREAPDE